MNDFEKLVELKKNSGFLYENGKARVVFAPDLGARVFCQLNGQSLHRLDIENVRNPNLAFNNYGGNNLWPAPEGGLFGFNYKGNEWYVQSAINDEPFVLRSKNSSAAKAVKQTVLKNRKGIEIEVVMEREFAAADIPELIADTEPLAAFAYTVDDRISVLNTIKSSQALLACWTLEQFCSTKNTISFAKVQNPAEAINFDFYDHPGDKISYSADGFFYQTDSRKRGQIGVKKDACAEFIGFYDLEKKLLCIRQIIEQKDGLYFNIADNEQASGPFSAADNYSIFNGDESLGFFEIETIGTADIQNECLKGSHLISKTSFAIYDNAESIQKFIQSLRS